MKKNMQYCLSTDVHGNLFWKQFPLSSEQVLREISFADFFLLLKSIFNHFNFVFRKLYFDILFFIKVYIKHNLLAEKNRI